MTGRFTVTAAMVSHLRDMTDAPLMECKKALTACEGSLPRAAEYIRDSSNFRNRLVTIRPKPIARSMKIASDFSNIAEFKSNWTQEEVKNEPMLFSCSGPEAWKMGGPITKAFLRSMADTEAYMDDCAQYGECIVDSRVHMLMPGWFPCIPGWHHDDIDRGGKYGQPIYPTDLRDLPNRNHYMGLVNAEVAPTEFIHGELELSDPYLMPNVYQQWDREVEAMLNQEKKVITKYHAVSGRVIKFDHLTMHRGTPAVSNGWRWFIRVTFNSKRPITNEIRRQVQAYLPTLNQGW